MAKEKACEERDECLPLSLILFHFWNMNVFIYNSTFKLIIS